MHNIHLNLHLGLLYVQPNIPWKKFLQKNKANYETNQVKIKIYFLKQNKVARFASITLTKYEFSLVWDSLV